MKIKKPDPKYELHTTKHLYWTREELKWRKKNLDKLCYIPDVVPGIHAKIHYLALDTDTEATISKKIDGANRKKQLDKITKGFKTVEYTYTVVNESEYLISQIFNDLRTIDKNQDLAKVILESSEHLDYIIGTGLPFDSSCFLPMVIEEIIKTADLILLHIPNPSLIKDKTFKRDVLDYSNNPFEDEYSIVNLVRCSRIINTVKNEPEIFN